jgi:hypothetical protein
MNDVPLLTTRACYGAIGAAVGLQRGDVEVRCGDVQLLDAKFLPNVGKGGRGDGFSPETGPVVARARHGRDRSRLRSRGSSCFAPR